MPLDEIRAAAIEALFDDELASCAFVLKGGNALGLLRIGQRSSLDVDLSIPTDLANLDELAERLNESLSRAYSKRGYRAFDLRVVSRPSEVTASTPEWWGGYEVTFKIEPATSTDRGLGERRRTALVIGPLQQRNLRIQISKHEFCGSVTQVSLEETTIRVYAPAMLAAEKLRAICQQMKEYPHKKAKIPRARDFYDIQAICTDASIDMMTEDNLALVRECFAAKRVEPRLLKLIPGYREFHRANWSAVEVSVATPLLAFDAYFDFVSDLGFRVGSRLE